MELLQKTTSLYLNILYAIYLTCKYTASTYGFVLEDDITSLPTQIREKDGINFIRFEVHTIENFVSTENPRRFREHFQEILDMVIDAEVPFKLYKRADSTLGLIPVLFFDSISYEKDKAYIDIVYVNNMASYCYVKPKRPNPMI